MLPFRLRLGLTTEYRRIALPLGAPGTFADSSSRWWFSVLARCLRAEPGIYRSPGKIWAARRRSPWRDHIFPSRTYRDIQFWSWRTKSFACIRGCLSAYKSSKGNSIWASTKASLLHMKRILYRHSLQETGILFWTGCLQHQASLQNHNIVREYPLQLSQDHEDSAS